MPNQSEDERAAACETLYEEAMTNMKTVSFTGTRAGMTLKQQGHVLRWLARLRQMGATTFKHGMCIGADAEAHKSAFALGYAIHGHPSDTPEMVAEFDRSQFESVSAAEPPLERNRSIALADVLLVAPRQRREERRSGTWATYRYAADKGTPCIVVWP